MQSRSLDLLDALFSRSDCNLNSLNKCIFFIEVLDFLGNDWTNDLGIEVLHIFHELNPKRRVKTKGKVVPVPLRDLVVIPYFD